MPEYLIAVGLLSAAGLVLAYIAGLILFDGAVTAAAGWEHHLGELGGLTVRLPPDVDATQDLTAHMATIGPGAYLGRHHEDTVDIVPAAWRPAPVNPSFAYVLANWSTP